MTGRRVVSDSSPLIALDRIGRLDVLEGLFGQVVAPPAVLRETFAKQPPSWLIARSLARPIPPLVVQAALGPGESETIALALESPVDWVLLDDEDARRLGLSLGLPVMGTLGALLMAKDRGRIGAVKPILDALVRAGFYLAPDLIGRVLVKADEAT